MIISGLTIVRNALSNGYMIAEVIDTLAAVSDEVIVCDGFSTDGTFEYLQTRDDIKLFQDNWNLKSQNGLEFAKITDHGLKRCTGDYIFYLQADELIHENQIEPLRQLILSNQHNSISCKFHHIRYDFDHCLVGGYERAIRIIRNGPDIYSDYDGYNFAGSIHPQLVSGINIYHFGYIFLKNILNKMINHAENFYVNAPNYANRKKLAQDYLRRINNGEIFDALELQKTLEPEYTLTKHGLALPSCMERLKQCVKFKPVHEYTLPIIEKPIIEEPQVRTTQDLIEQTTSWNISDIQLSRCHRGTVWINRALKIAALNIPKCGTTSIRIQFKLTELINIEDVPDDYFKFAIIRDPINRFISAYIEVVQHCETYPEGRYNVDLDLPKEQITFLDELMANYDDCGRFTIYLNKIQDEWGFFESHCVPQVLYLFDKDDNLYPDVEIFKLSNLSRLEERLDSEIIRSNQSENPELKQKLFDFVSANTTVRSQIEQLYEYDLRIWQEYEA